jgi:hypothetical protein
MHQIVRGPDLARDEDHFVVHLTGERRSATAPDPGADGWRWWTLHEIESSTEFFQPPNIERLLSHALSGRMDPIEDDVTIH